MPFLGLEADHPPANRGRVGTEAHGAPLSYAATAKVRQDSSRMRLSSVPLPPLGGGR